MVNTKNMERLERGLNLLGYTEDYVSYAETGSEYYTYSREDGSGAFTVRFADHGECYCREDFSIDPSGMTVTQVLTAIAKREGKSLRALQTEAAKAKREDLKRRRADWIAGYAAQTGINEAEAERLCPIDK